MAATQAGDLVPVLVVALICCYEQQETGDTHRNDKNSNNKFPYLITPWAAVVLNNDKKESAESEAVSKNSANVKLKACVP